MLLDSVFRDQRPSGQGRRRCFRNSGSTRGPTSAASSRDMDRIFSGRGRWRRFPQRRCKARRRRGRTRLGSVGLSPFHVDNLSKSTPDPPLDLFIDAPCGPPLPIVPDVKRTLLDVTQSTTSNISDLSDTGGFFTVQGAYDYQFAPRWVAGAFVDADWSDLSAHARQTHISSPGSGPPVQDVVALFSVGDQKTTIDTQLSTDWSISVGGRIGWLANPGTLLYFLAAYTHQDLSDARVKVSIAAQSSLLA